jgi:hypothetical protein
MDRSTECAKADVCRSGRIVCRVQLGELLGAKSDRETKSPPSKILRDRDRPELLNRDGLDE